MTVYFQGWLYAIELYHFVHSIAKGKARCVEVLYCPDSAQLIQKDQWKQLKSQLNYAKVTSNHNLLLGRCTVTLKYTCLYGKKIERWIILNGNSIFF